MFCLILLILFFSRRWYWHAPYYNAWSHPYGYGYGQGYGYYPYGAYSYYNPYWNQGYGYGAGPYGRRW